jgi:hypothetical protein
MDVQPLTNQQLIHFAQERVLLKTNINELNPDIIKEVKRDNINELNPDIIKEVKRDNIKEVNNNVQHKQYK